MIFKSFLVGNLVSLCMKIINSVVVVGLYYGFLTTFSIGPSYLFLLRAQVMEEGTEKKVSATTGFITGQLMMFISIYYAPLHLALGRPHTITVLALPYLLFHFFWNNHKNFFDYGSTTRNSMRNLSIQCVFLNNLIFQLFNHFILPSSMLARLVNIYMFRCNNKMLFVTSSFVGWLIGHILFMKWVGLVLVWIRQNNSIRSNVLIRSNKSELRNYMARIFSILLFITCVYYLGRIPSPIFTKKLNPQTEEGWESEEETDVEIETASETKGTKQEQEGSTEEDPSPSLFSEEKEDPDKIDETEEIRVNGKEKTKDEFHFTETRYNNSPVYKGLFWFEKPLLTFLFDYKRWNRPLRYIKNNRFERTARKEMSQYFFYTCRSDGKERISFTYPPSLSTFGEMIQRRMSLPTLEKLSSDELYNHWVYTNQHKNNNLNNEFLNRIEALDTGFFSLDILEKSTRLCNDKTRKYYLPKMYDPVLNGLYRGTIKKKISPSIINKISLENFIETMEINKIHSLLLPYTDYQEVEQKIDRFDKKTFSTENRHLFTLISKFDRESGSSLNWKGLSLFSEKEQGRIGSEKRAKFYKFLLNTILTSPNGQKTKQKFVIKEISKKVPRWSYKLITELEFLSGAAYEGLPLDYHIRSRKRDRVIIYRPTKRSRKASVKNWVSIRDYSEESDFRREFIKGSMRVQRRKTFISKLFQANAHSPLFLDRIKKYPLFYFNIPEQMKFFFRNWMGKGAEFKDYTEEQKKRQKEKEENKIKEKTWIKIAEAWDFVPYPQATRSLILIIQSIFRKYILLPSLIIVKNIGRILLSQPPEWAEDFDEWNREKHIICTYNGVQVSELELPRNWFKDGIQIKIVFPFYLKPWHRSKLRPSFSSYKDLKKEQQKFSFLMAWGTQTTLPFGSFGYVPPKPSFFKPIFKELKKKIRKTKNNHFRVLSVLKERTKNFLQDSKEPKRVVIKNVLFLFIKKIKKALLKVHLTRLFILRKVYESGETNKKKDSIIRNKIIHDSFRKIKSTDNTNYSLREKKIKNLADRTRTIRKKTKSLTKEKNSNAEKRSSPNKTSYNGKEKSPKIFWKILKIKKRSNRLIYKLDLFIKIFIKRIYIDIFLCIIHIARIPTQLVLESRNFCFDKYIYNNKTNQEIKNKKNKKEINFISTLKSELYNIKNSKRNSHFFFDLSSLSQAYVFYKLSQTQVINLYKLRSIFEYHGTPVFLKTAIKNYFVTQGIFHSELRHTKLSSSETNQWKNWLRGHYQYNLSQIRWFELIPQKWQTTINEGGITQNKDLTKWNSYEKDRLLYHKKQKDFKVYPLPNQKDNFPKYYIYNLLSYKSINSEIKKSSYIIYGSPSELNNNKKITFNYNNYKQNLFESLEEIPINHYLEKGDIMYMQKNPDRKYFDWTILNFFLRQKIDIEAWTKMDYSSNINTKLGSKNYQKIDKIDKNNIYYLMIHQDLEINPINDKKLFFDWMEMNEEILNPISTNLKLPFFPEFVPLYNIYKIKPWIIPSKLLLFNLNKNINEKKKLHFFRPSNEKRYSELMNRNQEEKEPAGRRGLGSYSQNQDKMKKQYKIRNKMRPEMIFLRKHYLLFQWIIDDGLIPNLTERMINNIKIYCYLLGLINPRDTTISSIQRKEINLDIMVIRKKLTPIELNKKGIFFIDPIRLSVKNDGYFIIYQTVGISLVHKSKYQTPQRYREQRYIHKNKLDESIPRYQIIIRKRDKKHYDFIVPEIVPEKILSSRRRRELRILISFNSKNINSVDKNRVFCNKKNIKNRNPFLDQKKHLDRDKNELIKLKLFLWPNYRLEDLACMNRYWFNTNNGSCFSLLRIYPQLKIG
uniref:Ycf1 protein n=2 Tax=Ligusticum yushuense TaxID=3024257 RepID=UPI0023AA9D8E|nr:Ycf1 protein [Ligusticum yushuense]WCF68112.1 Ycf1 protein [Ligusticum yushuense]WVH46007.1 hypothetical protein RF1 [Trachydium subnudum]